MTEAGNRARAPTNVPSSPTGHVRPGRAFQAGGHALTLPNFRSRIRMAALPIEAAKRLSDRLVHLHDERLVRRRARLGAVLSKAVVGHDGVVHGVADDG